MTGFHPEIYIAVSCIWLINWFSDPFLIFGVDLVLFSNTETHTGDLPFLLNLLKKLTRISNNHKWHETELKLDKKNRETNFELLQRTLMVIRHKISLH